MKTQTMRNFFIGICCVAGGIFFTGKGLRAQDIHFSQFYETPLLRNPALAGIFTGDYRVQTVMRSQWNTFANSFRTVSLSGEYKMPIGKSDDFITLGLQTFMDQAGRVDLLTTHFLPALNYHKSLSSEKPMYLSFGIMGGMIRKSIKLYRLTTDNQWQGNFEPTRPIGEEALVPQFTTMDAGAGLSFNSSFGQKEKNLFFAGVAMHHINQPRNSFYAKNNISLPRKMVYSAGIRFGVDDFTSFILQADHSTQGGSSESIIGALYSYNLGQDPENPEYTIQGGAFIRWKDAIIPVIKMEKRGFYVSIGYDVNISPLRPATRGHGAIELSLGYIGFVKKMSSTLEKVICPKF